MIPHNGASEKMGDGNMEAALIADAPYSLVEEENLKAAIPYIDSDFIIHLGDITAQHSPDVPCEENLYSNMYQILKRSRVPVFIIPGDNEWTDCINDEQAWKFWTRYFLRFDLEFSHNYKVTRQEDREENFAFTYQGSTFIGLNLTKPINDSRFEKALSWCKEKLTKASKDVRIVIIFAHPLDDKFIDDLTENIKNFAKPVLYVHGDIHVFRHTKKYKGISNLDILSLPRGRNKNSIIKLGLSGFSNIEYIIKNFTPPKCAELGWEGVFSYWTCTKQYFKWRLGIEK